MSQVETLPPSCAIDFAHSAEWTTTSAVVNDLAGTNTTHTYTNINTSDEAIFPDLPPLHRGHPDVHLRNGVIHAARLAEPDAEKAFFVADLSHVYRQHQRWVAALPEITPFYAVKCNPDPYVLRLLAALGAGFDCASHGEISAVLRLGGVAPGRIVFANPCKATSFVRAAARAGVDLMTFDNADELHKIARAHPAARLVLRILPDDSKSLCALGIKFGAPLAGVPALLNKAKELGLDVVGVSFHVGSGCFDPRVYTDAVARARAAWDAGAAAGYTFSMLDVGGGFEDALFEQAARVLRDAIDVYFPNRRGIKVIAEPGRFYVSKAFSLACNIIARRAPPEAAAGGEEEDADKPSVMYYINDGVYGAFNCVLFDHQTAHPLALSMDGSFHVPADAPQRASSVWGPTCDSIDCVAPAARLPAGLRVGDWLRFDGMGAYTVCAASTFNGFEVSRVVYTSGAHGPGAEEVRGVLAGFAKEGL
ncbi:pyridoxal-dependent decarboxylase [Mycena sp. CBHHK59/15]|nr:pyridoxal-dependent decarboxylase [Mycena sp. CBHHK59/15]